MRIKKKEIQEKITPQVVKRQIDDIVNVTKKALGPNTDEETAQEFLKAVVSSDLNEVGGDTVHTSKFDRCVKAVEKSGDVDNPYAVCQASIGAGAIKKSHRRKEDDEYIKSGENIDEDNGTGEDFGDIPMGRDIEAGETDYEEYQDLLRTMSKDSSGINYNEKPTDDLPFESVKPKMSKKELIESIVGKKTRRVLKTIKVNELKNK